MVFNLTNLVVSLFWQREDNYRVINIRIIDVGEGIVVTPLSWDVGVDSGKEMSTHTRSWIHHVERKSLLVIESIHNV